MTFPSVPKGLPAKLCLLLLVAALFPHAAMSRQPMSQQSRPMSFTIDTPNLNQLQTMHPGHLFITAGNILVSAAPPPRPAARERQREQQNQQSSPSTNSSHPIRIVAMITAVAGLISAIAAFRNKTRA
jgi:hypothetical protein